MIRYTLMAPNGKYLSHEFRMQFRAQDVEKAWLTSSRNLIESMVKVAPDGTKAVEVIYTPSLIRELNSDELHTVSK